MIKIKACYTVSELAELLGLCRKRTFRLLSRSGLIAPATSRRRKRVVWISELRDRNPEIFESMAIIQAF